ncbi:MAG: bile acid:sodium symporter, partial [Acidimicrobiia bacterium]|nr:bile acid:sodium symporter [Acidimicrobiia bacterium]
EEFFGSIAAAAGLIFVVGSMLAMGLSFTMSQLLEPLKNVRLVVVVLVANFVLVTLLAWGITRVSPLDESLEIGLLILACVAGAPFLPKEVQAAKGNLATGVAVMFLLMVVTIVYAPVVLPWLLPGAEVNAWDLAKSLIVTMAVPLAIGLLVRSNHPDESPAWAAISGKASGIAVLVLLAVGLGLNAANIVSLVGSYGFLALVLFAVGSLLVGLLVGGRDAAVRSVTGLGTAQRNVAAAVLVATVSFGGTMTLPYILVASIVLPLILLPTAKALGRRADKTAP